MAERNHIVEITTQRAVFYILQQRSVQSDKNKIYITTPPANVSPQAESSTIESPALPTAPETDSGSA